MICNKNHETLWRFRKFIWEQLVSHAVVHQNWRYVARIFWLAVSSKFCILLFVHFNMISLYFANLNILISLKCWFFPFFYHILAKFNGFWRVSRGQKFDMAVPSWPPFWNHDIVPTARDIMKSFCGPRRKHLKIYYPPSMFRCYSLTLGVTVPPPHRIRNEEKKFRQSVNGATSRVQQNVFITVQEKKNLFESTYAFANFVFRFSRPIGSLCCGGSFCDFYSQCHWCSKVKFHLEEMKTGL